MYPVLDVSIIRTERRQALLVYETFLISLGVFMSTTMSMLKNDRAMSFTILGEITPVLMSAELWKTSPKAFICQVLLEIAIAFEVGEKYDKAKEILKLTLKRMKEIQDGSCKVSIARSY